jgi:hypothetical protein
LLSKSCDDIFVMWRRRFRGGSCRCIDLIEKIGGLYSEVGFAKENTITKCCVLEMWKTSTNTAWSIYWAPPSARFVTHLRKVR